VNFSDIVAEIGYDAFENCRSLQRINIPAGTYDKFADMLPNDHDKLHELTAAPDTAAQE